MADLQPESGDDQKEDVLRLQNYDSTRIHASEQKESITIDFFAQRSCRAMRQAAVAFPKNALPH